jgi:hypothetical protein
LNSKLKKSSFQFFVVLISIVAAASAYATEAYNYGLNHQSPLTIGSYGGHLGTHLPIERYNGHLDSYQYGAKELPLAYKTVQPTVYQINEPSKYSDSLSYKGYDHVYKPTYYSKYNTPAYETIKPIYKPSVHGYGLYH